MDYCTVLLNPTTKADILAACIQADAAIRAAHEQAGAAIRAAKYQAAATTTAGWLTLIAGAFVIFGSWIAYLAALRSVRLPERRYAIRRNAHRTNLARTVKRVLQELANLQRETFYKFSRESSVAAINILMRASSPSEAADLMANLDLDFDFSELHENIWMLEFYWKKIHLHAAHSNYRAGEDLPPAVESSLVDFEAHKASLEGSLTLLLTLVETKNPKT